MMYSFYLKLYSVIKVRPVRPDFNKVNKGITDNWSVYINLRSFSFKLIT